MRHKRWLKQVFRQDSKWWDSPVSIYELECLNCGELYTSIGSSSKYCPRCYREKREARGEARASFPKTAPEVLAKVHDREEELRKQYVHDNWVALGDGVALEDARMLLREAEEWRQSKIEDKEEEE